MQELTQAVAHAINLVVMADADLLEIVSLSLRVSLLAVLFSTLIGLPLGAALAVTRFRGRGLITVLVNSMMGLPPVVVGLLVYLALSASGPLGSWRLLYTPVAMIIAQAVLVTPIIIALSRQTLSELHREYEQQLTLFGLSTWGKLRVVLWDGRYSLLTTLLAGFGRAIAEVGAVILVGGNIDHVTRVMTTTIALETSRGNLALALALGLILLCIAFSVNALVAMMRFTSRSSTHG